MGSLRNTVRRAGFSRYRVADLLLGLVLFAATIVGWKAYQGARGPADRAGEGEQSDFLRDVGPVGQRSEPLKIAPILPDVPVNREWEAVDAASKRLWPLRNDSISVVLHALQVFEPGSQPPDGESPTLAEMRAVILDRAKNAAWYGEQASLVQTREGLRYISSVDPVASASAHVDQVLAILGRLGVSLDHSLQTPAGPATLRKVLEDCVANFHIDGEIEWTAVALAVYLPPQRSWRNKSGQQFDFDSLARELMSRPLDRTACKGTHDLYALALLFRVDRLTPVLSKPCRKSVESFLRQTVAALRRGQLACGAFSRAWYAEILEQPWYWDIVQESDNNFPEELGKLRDWHVDPETRDQPQPTVDESKLDTSSLVQMTGHHLEWLILLPAEMQPDVELFRRAVAYSMEALEKASDEELLAGFCPYSHVARVLRLLGRRSLAEMDGAVLLRPDPRAGRFIAKELPAPGLDSIWDPRARSTRFFVRRNLSRIFDPPACHNHAVTSCGFHIRVQRAATVSCRSGPMVRF